MKMNEISSIITCTRYLIWTQTRLVETFDNILYQYHLSKIFDIAPVYKQGNILNVFYSISMYSKNSRYEVFRSTLMTPILSTLI